MDINRSVDLSVGFLLILGIVCLGYISVTFGNVNPFGMGRYPVKAIFGNVTGVQENTEVQMLGTRVGRVESIKLKNYKAHVTLSIDRDVTLPKGTVASIKTKGLLGEKYVSLSPGGMPGNIKKDGSGIISETNEPLILEDMIGKMIFSQPGEKS